MKHLAAVDLETTGLIPTHHEITEIAIILLDQRLDEIDRFHSLVFIKDPDKGYSNRIEQPDGSILDVFQMTGIDPADLAEAPELPEIAEKIEGFLEKNLGKDFSNKDIWLFGQNISFDELFLKELFKQTEISYPFDYHKIDLASVFATQSYVHHGVFPDSVSQSAMEKWFDIKNEKAHSAMSDIETSIKIYKKIIEEW